MIFERGLTDNIFYKIILKERLKSNLNTVNIQVFELHLKVSMIDSILSILSDGKFHKIKDLKIQIDVDDFQIKEILDFMCRFDFVDIVNEKKVRTKKSFKRLIEQKIN